MAGDGTQIDLAPTNRGWSQSREEFESLADVLADRGVRVSLKPPGPPPPEGLPKAAGMDFAIHVVGEIGAAVGAPVIEEALRQAFRRTKRRTPVMGVIYGPNGEILREVSLQPRRRFDRIRRLFRRGRVE
jgi:hypothetical protein